MRRSARRFLKELSPEGELLSLLVHCAEGANGEAGPKGEPRSGE
jgi:hypothetical protein